MKNTRKTEDVLKQIENLSDKDKVAYLFGIIDQEKDKPWDQIDLEMIEECSRHIDRLIEHELPELTDERIEDIRKKNDARVKVTHRSAPRKRKLVKRIIGIAAAVAILFCAATVTVSAYAENMSIGEYIVYVVKNLSPGESIDHNGITFIHEEETTTYDDIKALIENEKLEIYYPTELPDGVYMKEIILSGDLTKAEESKLIFVFNDPGISLTVRNYQSFDLTDKTYSTYTTNVGVFCIIKTNGVYQAISQTETYEYRLSAPDEATVKYILKGLKKS